MHHRPISSSTPRTTRRAVLHAALAAPLALGLAGQAAAQTAATAFPSKTIRFVVPYPPGGPTDLMARMLQPELQSRLGVPEVVDNKGGAGGNTGSAEVAKQANYQTAMIGKWHVGDGPGRHPAARDARSARRRAIARVPCRWSIRGPAAAASAACRRPGPYSRGRCRTIARHARPSRR